MADPLSVCASVIAVVTLAYESSKALHDLVQSIRDAPRTVADLFTDISTLEGILTSLKEEVNQSSAGQFSSDQVTVLLSLVAPLESCTKVCNEFIGRLKTILSHSQGGSTSFRDKAKLPFYEKEILAFRFRLNSYKSTLTVGLGIATFKTTNANQQTLRDFENRIIETQNVLKGQIQGLAMGVQDALVMVDHHASSIIKRNEAQISDLSRCLRVCLNAWSQTSRQTNTTIKLARAFDESRILLGTIGNLSAELGTGGGSLVTVEEIGAWNRARVMGGNIEGSVALEFLK